MVARPGQYQASMNSGELSPDVWGRSDIKQFYSGASLMINATPVPQGGFDALPGTAQVGFVRDLMAEVGRSDLTNYGPHAVPAVIFTSSFAACDLVAVDLFGFSSSIDIDAGLVVETSLDGTSWSALGGVLNLRTAARSRRIATTPGDVRRATQVRLRVVSAPAPYSFAMAGFAVLARAAPATTARSFEHTFSVDKAFVVVVTQGNADIWLGDSYVASIAIACTESQIGDLSSEQRFDSMLLFHREVPPQRLMRRDSDFDWSAEIAAWENIPLVDYGAGYGNVVEDFWTITINWSMGPSGLQLGLNVNGEDAASTALPAGPDWPAFCVALKANIEALPSVAPGVAVTFNAPGGAQYAEIGILFAGAGNAGARFAVTPRIVNVTWAAANASHLQFGDPGGEDIMSAGRGWPSTGNFYQDRLFLGGFRSEGSAFLGSVTGEYFDLNTKLENPAGGVLVRLDTSGAERIQTLCRAKHLVLFTDSAEYYVTDRAIARGTVPNIAQSSRNGSAAGIRVVENESSLLYVGRSRAIVYAHTYSDVSQIYESEPISLLASHLVKGVTGAAIQKSSESTDAARYWLTRADGLLVCGVMIRNQDVIAFVRWVTDGKVRDVVVDGANRAFVLVERVIGGTARLVRERLDETAWLHQQRAFSFAEPVSTLSGLTDFEGAEVWAICDGYPHGPITVAGGAIALPYPAAEIRVGRWVAPLVRTLPVPRLVGERTVLQRPVRVHTVRCTSSGSTSLAIGANGRPARDALFLRAGQAGDAPLPPYHGPVLSQGHMGWSEDGFVVITQLRPGGFAVRNATIEART